MHDDLVERVFTATRLNQLWLTDITEHWTAGIQADEGKLYLCAIKDVLDRAQRKLALRGGPELGDVGEPELVRAAGGELVPGPPVLIDNGAQVIVGGKSGLPTILPRFFSNALHQPLSRQIRHAVRSTIDSPVSRASSARSRCPNSRSPRWASNNAFARYASTTSLPATGSTSHR